MDTFYNLSVGVCDERFDAHCGVNQSPDWEQPSHQRVSEDWRLTRPFLSLSRSLFAYPVLRQGHPNQHGKSILILWFISYFYGRYQALFKCYHGKWRPKTSSEGQSNGRREKWKAGQWVSEWEPVVRKQGEMARRAQSESVPRSLASVSDGSDNADKNDQGIYHEIHFYLLFIAELVGHLKTSENVWNLDNGMLTRYLLRLL